MSNIPYFYKNVDFWTRLPAGGQTQKLDFLNSLDDEDFFDHWAYECNAYNVVFEGMSKLFVKSA